MYRRSILAIFSAICPLWAQDFSGAWKLNRDRSEIRAMPSQPPDRLRIEQKGNRFRCQTVGAAKPEAYEWLVHADPKDRKETRSKLGESTWNSMGKWEGSALLIHSLVSGPSNYTQMDRWKLSRDGRTLTVRRVIVERQGEIESTLVYEREP